MKPSTGKRIVLFLLDWAAVYVAYEGVRTWGFPLWVFVVAGLAALLLTVIQIGEWIVDSAPEMPEWMEKLDSELKRYGK